MKTFITIIFLFSSGIGFAQITFQRTFGGSDFDFGLTVQQATDGGYILLGQTTSFGNGEQDMYLIKTDDQGNELWYQTFGGPDWEFGISVQQTTDGGYILCGGYSGIGDDSLALIKTDINGIATWEKTYSGSVDRDVGQFVQQTSDGGYIAVGFTGPDYTEDIYMVKTDANGDEQWNKVHSYAARELAVGVRQTIDGGFIMVGAINDTIHGPRDMFLVKTNDMGDTLWTKRFGSATDEVGTSVYVTSDNGFIVLGFEEFPGGDLLLVKTDSLGNQQWNQVYGGNGWDMGYGVQQTSDGGYVLAGRKENLTLQTNDMYCIKTDPSGGVEWEYTYPLGIMSNAHSVHQTTDGGFVLLGSTLDTFPTVDADVYMVKTNGLGLLSVYDDAPDMINVNLFPNPFSEHTYLELNDSMNREFSLNLINPQGKIVRCVSNISNGRLLIERRNLEPGLYIFQLFTTSGLVASGKFIVN